MQEFFVANNRVDILRNQIVREGEVIALEPKVLEVLRVLAEHQGDVVSHQTLLDAVWPDIVVAPNALQRCIGQLRKALGDDGKTQKVIATHPKRGYSLLAPVSVRTNPDSKDSKSESSPHAYETSGKNNKFLWLSITLIVVFCALYLTFPGQQHDSTPLQRFTRLSPLTATDASEFYSTFSPEGRYVAFSRKLNSRHEHMWLLDRESGREIQLTAEPGSYGKPVWSTDGKHMAFLDTSHCENGCGNTRCVDIDVIFMPLALGEPQPVKQLVECEPIPFLGLEWLTDKHIAYINNSGDSSEISQHNIQTGEVKSLFTSDNSTLYSLSFSEVKQLLAVMQTDHEQNPSLFLLSPESGVVTEQVFTSPKRYNSKVQWSPVWDHAGDHLLFSASSRLFLMDLQGKLHSKIIPTFEDISYPMFHPDGSSIAMTLGKVDTDVAELQLSNSDSDTFANHFTETPFARSILRENNSQYQPNGSKIAFFSKRGGDRQIWLTDNNQVSQLSHIKELFPEHFVWSPNGQQIAIATEHQILLLDMQGKMESLALPFAASGLYQWLHKNELLMQVTDEDGPKLVSYNISNNSYQTLQNVQSYWAQSDGENTWYADGERRLKQISGGNSKTVEMVSEIEMGSRFFLRNQQLFMLSNQDDVWRLNLNSNQLTRLFHYPNTTVWLTDVSNDGKQMLISKQLSAKKEIVLLTP